MELAEKKSSQKVLGKEENFLGLEEPELCSYEKANYYLNQKGEVILRFKAASKAQFELINKTLSVGHQKIDENLLEGEAYANRAQFQYFSTLGIAYTVEDHDNVIPQEYTDRSSASGRAAAAWDTSWDAYPKYSEYVAKMNQYLK